MVPVLYLTLLFTSALAWLWSPEQVHLAWTENEKEMSVMFVTQWPLLFGFRPYVYYRPYICRNIETSEEFIYTAANTDEFNAGEYDDGTRYIYIYEARMSGLDKNCEYQYYVGSFLGLSDYFYFSGLTPDYEEPYETLDESHSVVIYGDWGTGQIGMKTRNLLAKMAQQQLFDAVLHIGDIAYDLSYVLGYVADAWFQEAEVIAGFYPYMTTPGNHELHLNMTAYKSRFHMPATEANLGTGLFYSFNLGRAHYVMINTECYLYENNEYGSPELQTEWLKQDLAKANQEREIRPWIFVLTHHPLYCSVNWRVPLDAYYDENWDGPQLQCNADCGIEGLMFQEWLEDIFYEAGVDIYFQAHVHFYERNSAIYKNQTVPSEIDEQNMTFNTNAPIYITSGNAGNYEGHNDDISPTPQYWEQFSSTEFGFGKLTVFNETHVYWQYISSQSHEVVDYFWLTKDRPRYNLAQNSKRSN